MSTVRSVLAHRIRSAGTVTVMYLLKGSSRGPSAETVEFGIYLAMSAGNGRGCRGV